MSFGDIREELDTTVLPSPDGPAAGVSESRILTSAVKQVADADACNFAKRKATLDAGQMKG